MNDKMFEVLPLHAKSSDSLTNKSYTNECLQRHSDE